MHVQAVSNLLNCGFKDIFHHFLWLILLTSTILLHVSWLHSKLSPGFGQINYWPSSGDLKQGGKIISNGTIASEIEEQSPKILCWVMTHPKNHQTKAIHIRNTWGSRCHKLVFVSSVEDPELGTIKLENAREGHSHLWSKTLEAFKYIWTKYGQDYDWFLKTDDDTYVVVENLERLLREYDSNKATWFGFRLKQYSETGYMSGGSGYVLSQEALRRFIKLAAEHPFACPSANSVGAEDVNMGKCMKNAKVEFGDSRDSQGRQRFMFLNPHDFLGPSFNRTPLWASANSYYPLETGENCCSDTAIAFHYVEPVDMYLYDYLIYRLNPAVKAFSK